MGLFGNKKKNIKHDEQERLDEELRDDLSKAYDELVAGGTAKQEENVDETPAEEATSFAEDYGTEQFITKLKNFTENKTDEAFREL